MFVAPQVEEGLAQLDGLQPKSNGFGTSLLFVFAIRLEAIAISLWALVLRCFTVQLAFAKESFCQASYHGRHFRRKSLRFERTSSCTQIRHMKSQVTRQLKFKRKENY